LVSSSNRFISDTTCGGKSVRPGQENAIKLKFNCATKVAALLTAVASICIDTAVVHATRKQKHDDRDGIYYYGPAGPNVSYRSGPHTRIYVTKRSWLDAGGEVFPGDRKFTDYAFPPGYSFGRENGNLPIDREPLDPPSDVGGYPQMIPANQLKIFALSSRSVQLCLRAQAAAC
jgi:hypothetical protein